jgi:hypothetical protein
MIAHPRDAGNLSSLTTRAEQLLELVRQAAQQGRAVHELERDIWGQVLQLGRAALGLFLELQGTGDLGPTVTLSNGNTAARLPDTHTRPYRSVFGDFTLQRTCYGTRDGQKIALVPLDARLQLPEETCSYLLQQWNQALGAESAFGRAASAVEDILGITQSVDSLERNNRHMAGAVASFRASRPDPPAKDEGNLFVASADGKGIPMRRTAADPQPKAHRGKGDKANKKRMAIVGAIYSVDRHVRTPEQVVEALFRDREPDPQPKRPEPVGKRLWARLSTDPDGTLAEPIGTVFGWLSAELGRRNAGSKGPVVCVMDGQEALWDGCREHLGAGVVEVLDLLHVAPRLWQAAHLFCREGSPEARAFVRDRLHRVLAGESRGVVTGLRRLGTVRGLSGTAAKRLAVICAYLCANEARMRYDVYLAAGYPIASGVIEGACRSYVKDRMERSGMRWTRVGAQAMLDVRSEYLNGQWDLFHQHRIRTETQRLYPHRTILEQIDWVPNV